MVCVAKQKKLEFREASVKSIRPGVGCRVILAGRSWRENTT